MDSQKRPIILSFLMICLFDGIKNDFKDNFMEWGVDTIISNIPLTIEKILRNEKIPEDKIKVLKNQFEYAIKDDIDISSTDIVRDILKELKINVIPLFKTNTNYDIIGKFYEEFLRYAGVTNVKNGIVLTPRHVTELFTELIDIKLNDVIFDSCCGTGAFLIAGMNKIFKLIETSNISEKKKLKEKVKETQLIGFEKNATMFALSISNMLFRGDGKSQIYHVDFFDEKADDILKNKNPTIGFINPPYGGSGKKNSTKKEIQFLIKLLDCCSRYAIIIAPLSTYFKEDDLRNKILAKHTLKYVINMPNELFQPNASTHTAIAVFETNSPHNNKEVFFYNLEDDGFILSKQKGRTNILNKWNSIKNNLLKELQNPDKFVDDLHFVKTAIKENDEWIIQAHSKTDYSTLKEEDFLNSIREYVIFKTKKNLNLLDKDLNELEILEMLNNSKINGKKFLEDN
jgi:type I restriction-modification system DNA methylase subunit